LSLIHSLTIPPLSLICSLPIPPLLSPHPSLSSSLTFLQPSFLSSSLLSLLYLFVVLSSSPVASVSLLHQLWDVLVMQNSGLHCCCGQAYLLLALPLKCSRL